MDGTAFDEAVGHFKVLKEPRQPRTVDHKLPKILLLGLPVVIARAETITDIALLGRKKPAPCVSHSATALVTPGHMRMR